MLLIEILTDLIEILTEQKKKKSMAKLKLKVAKSGHMNPHTRKVGYIARAINSGTAGYDDIVSQACNNTTLHKAEAKVAFELCMETVAEMLMQGYIIDLGPVGKLYPKCTSAWVEKPEELQLDDVVPSVRYRPSKAMAEAVKGAVLQWAKGRRGSEKGDAPDR